MSDNKDYLNPRSEVTPLRSGTMRSEPTDPWQVRFRGIFLLLLCVLLASRGSSEQVRVTSWTLNGLPGDSRGLSSAEAEEERLPEVAKVLKELNPDVILLQGVRDSEACEKLTDYLKPDNYRVLVCSAFKEGISGKDRKKQLAIISKKPALAAWTEPWKTDKQISIPGGFAFADILIGTKEVGFYSIYLQDNLTAGNFERENQLNILKRELAVEHLLKHLSSVGYYISFSVKLDLQTSSFGRSDSAGYYLTNRMVGWIVGGDFNTSPNEPRYESERTLRLLEEAGLTNDYSNVPRINRVGQSGKGKSRDLILDYIFAKQVRFATRSEISVTELSDHSPVTSDLIITPFKTGAMFSHSSRSPKSRIEPGQAAAPKEEATVKGAANGAPKPSSQMPTQRALQTSPPLPDRRNTKAEPKGALEEAQSNSQTQGPMAIVVPQPSRTQSIWWWLVAALLVFSFLLFAFLFWPFREVKSPRTEDISSNERSEAIVDSAETKAKIRTPMPGPTRAEAQPWEGSMSGSDKPTQGTTAVLRAGLIPHLARLMRDKLILALMFQRSRMLDTQQTATSQVTELEQRMAQIQTQLHERHLAYELRIDQLEKELAAKEAEYRQLRARTASVEKSRDEENRSATL